MILRWCSICKIAPITSDFPASKRYWCKSCDANKQRSYRDKDIERKRLHNRLYELKRKSSYRAIRNILNQLRYMNDKQRILSERDPIKVKARRDLTNAVLRGEIVKQPCEICGELKVAAHHPNYNKPLEVRWLCYQHHAQLHREERNHAIITQTT